jgi:hypothetical protein
MLPRDLAGISEGDTKDRRGIMVSQNVMFNLKV